MRIIIITIFLLTLTTVAFAARQYLWPGHSFINEASTRQYLIPGHGFINETVVTTVVPRVFTVGTTLTVKGSLLVQ